MAKLDYSQQQIDLMKLYTESNSVKWNDFLTECFRNHDINRLMATRIGLQAGMKVLADGKLNSDKINSWYIRLNRSIEETAKKIIRVRHPMPTDNPNNKEFKTEKWIQAKKNRDNEFEEFLLRSSY